MDYFHDAQVNLEFCKNYLESFVKGEKMLENLKKEFLNPQDEYTPIPFWFWNDNLTEREIIRQIDDFNEKGVKGFVIHPRIGIPKEIEYLSDRFMELVKSAVLEAKRLGMKVVLYDEAMYPSGSAHGMVVKNNPEYASKGLKMIEHRFNEHIKITLSAAEAEKLVSAQAVKKVSEDEIIPESITKIPVIKDEINFVAPDSGEWSVLLFVETFTKGHIRGIHFGEDDGEKEPPASSDLLNLEAMKEFIKLTHDRYYEVLKVFFGNTIIGMFTDEPSIMGRGNVKGLKPWTGNFLDYYIEQGNSELDLPLLWFNAGCMASNGAERNDQPGCMASNGAERNDQPGCMASNGAERNDQTNEIADIKRRKYKEAINKKMEEAYYKPIYEWCTKHNIALTGHPESSDDIGFLKYFHMPAQDVVWRWVAPEDGLALEGQNSTMAKCTSDGARHRRRRRNGNECFACCGRNKVEWTFSADDMKWYMDWLFVRGVNLLFPHAFFYSIDGPRRIGERPPDVGPNNIWWPHYNQISDYIKRMSYLMTDSVNCAQAAVLCGAHHLPWQIVKPLYENQIEFNYLENELFISESCEIKGSSLKIAEQSYKILIIEDNKLIDVDNSDKIQKFIDNGGSVIIYNPENKEFNLRNINYINSFNDIVNVIDEAIDRDVKVANVVKNLRMTHINKNNLDFYVFVNEGEDEINTTVRINTVGSIEKWDAWKGSIETTDIVRKVEASFMDIDLKVNRREALILSVNTEDLPKATCNVCKNAETEKLNLDINWYMGYSTEKLDKISKLTPWNEIGGMEHYSGTMTYKNIFTVNKFTENKKVQLNLGEVFEIAQVSLNGKDLGVQMWSPYTFDVTDYIKEGENVLIVEVKNTLANRICNLSLKSGLIGPVNLSFSK